MLNVDNSCQSAGSVNHKETGSSSSLIFPLLSANRSAGPHLINSVRWRPAASAPHVPI